MFSKPINWWFIGFLGVLIASLWFTHLARIKHAVEINTNTVTTKLNTEYQKKLDKAVKDAIDSTKAMQDNDNRLKQEKYDKLQANNDKLSNDLISLRNRPVRPSPTVIAESSSSGGSCTAVQLYQEDAGFLTREAARAEGVLIERDNYYERYLAAKRELDRLAAEKK
jgi:hypothetical protein